MFEILIPVYRPDMKFQADAVILHGQQFDCHIRVSSGFDFSKVRIWSGFEVSKVKITGELQFTASHARFSNDRITVDSEPESAWIRSWSDWTICILIITKYEVVLSNFKYKHTVEFCKCLKFNWFCRNYTMRKCAEYNFVQNCTSCPKLIEWSLNEPR